MAMVETQEPILLDDEAWERIVRITGGAAAPCFQCGVCTAICPWGLVKNETVSIRKLIRSGQLGLDSGDFLWLCTTCGACVPPCPRGVDIPGVMLALREVAWRERDIPEGFPSMLWSEYWNGNPWERPPSEPMGSGSVDGGHVEGTVALADRRKQSYRAFRKCLTLGFEKGDELAGKRPWNEQGE